ncbi:MULTISPECIES: hypothetical protein [unclassified Microcoleus]|uniref:hypothetical protein n=1 Tax=unclassified Microcoleus TaxID=2642155 RepID=UPI002FD49709
MNNYVYYDSWSVIKAWVRAAILVAPTIGGDRQKFPNSQRFLYWYLVDALGRPR